MNSTLEHRFDVHIEPVFKAFMAKYPWGDVKAFLRWATGQLRTHRQNNPELRAKSEFLLSEIQKQAGGAPS